MAGGGHSDFWTDERIAELRRMHGEGLSGLEIAKALGISKSAVFGKKKRLGMCVSKAQLNFTKRQNGKAAAALQAATRPKPKPKPKPQPPPDEMPPAAKKLPKLGTIKPPFKKYQVPFGKVKAGQCRFPLWGLSEKTGNVCGAPVVTRGPHCPYHTMLCWRTASTLRHGGAGELADVAKALLPKAIGDAS